MVARPDGLEGGMEGGPPPTIQAGPGQPAAKIQIQNTEIQNTNTNTNHRNAKHKAINIKYKYNELTKPRRCVSPIRVKHRLGQNWLLVRLCVLVTLLKLAAKCHSYKGSKNSYKGLSKRAAIFSC